MPNLSVQKGIAIGIRDDLRSASVLATLNSGGGTLVADSIQERVVPVLEDFKSSPGAGEHQLPGILVVWPAVAESLNSPSGPGRGQFDNINDEWGWPVLIAIAAQSQRDLSFNADRYGYWRETIIARYITRRFSISDPATDFHACHVEPGPVVDWDRWAKDGTFASWFILRFFKKKQRPTS